MRTLRLLPAVAAAVLYGSAAALAQQPAPEPPRQDEPTITTEDITIADPAPKQETTADPDHDIDPETKGDGELTDEERADVERSGEKQAEAGKGKGPSAAERAWRQRYAAAKRVAEDAERAAQDAEIRITELRNELGSRGSDTRLVAELDRQGTVLAQARDRAKRAQAAFEAVRAEGARKKFSPEAAASTAKSGKGGQQSASAQLRTQYSEAKRRVEDINRRITLYQNRVSDLSTRLTINSGSGDNYAQASIQAELNKAREELQKAQAELPAAQQGFERARRAAAGAGVPVRDL